MSEDDDDFFNFVDLSKKRYVSDDAREQISATNKETWNNQSLKDNHSKILKEVWKRPDYREKKLAQIRNNPEDVIKGFREVHGDRYDYSKMDYQGNNKSIVITCSKHGDFEMTPKKHRGSPNSKQPRKPMGCEKCVGEEVIKDFKEVHGDQYDYSKVDLIICAKYASSRKVTIICSEHGEFQQTPYLHRRGSNCPTCAAIASGKTRKSFK